MKSSHWLVTGPRCHEVTLACHRTKTPWSPHTGLPQDQDAMESSHWLATGPRCHVLVTGPRCHEVVTLACHRTKMPWSRHNPATPSDCRLSFEEEEEQEEAEAEAQGDSYSFMSPVLFPPPLFFLMLLSLPSIFIGTSRRRQ